MQSRQATRRKLGAPSEYSMHAINYVQAAFENERDTIAACG